MKDIQEDDIFNRENLRRSLRFVYMKALQPAGATGTIASFDVVIPGLLKIKHCSLKRRTGEPIRLVTARIEQDGGFSVELRSWLRDAILRGAVAALRAKLEGELAALEKDGARAERPGEDTADMPADPAPSLGDAGPSRDAPSTITPDAATLPAMLMRAVA